MTSFHKLPKLKQNIYDFFSIRCKNCLMPNTAWDWNDKSGSTCQYCCPTHKEETTFPDDMLNDNGNLSTEDLIKTIRAQKKGRHNCLISITGGRDSSFTLYYVKEILGLNPIAFNFNTGFVTDIAQKNMANITKLLGIDFIQYSVDGKFLKKLSRGFFKNYGEVCSICHQGYFYTVQKVAQWTGLNYVIRGLCKDTEANRANPNYIDWYSLTDEDFKKKVESFAVEEQITERELEENREFMKLREWTDKNVKRIDLPDMLEYGYEEIVDILNKLNWKQDAYFIHLDCSFVPILVCCQRLADGYSKKHINISNLSIDGVDKGKLKKLLLQEENIGFSDVKEIELFLKILGIDRSTFEDAIINTWGRKRKC